MATDCTCNVYAADGSGRVVAWRSWGCPVHRSDPPPKSDAVNIGDAGASSVSTTEVGQ